MEKPNRFNLEQIKIINQAVAVSEESVADYFKLSINQWRRHRYDIKTVADLSLAEIVHGPFAQIIRYEGKRNEISLGSSVYDFYKICLQDHAMLAALERAPLLELLPFSIYVVTHELVHIVRFSRFLINFQAKNDEKDIEEAKVHRETHCILRSVQIPGMDFVFDFFKNIREPLDGLMNS